MLTDAAVPEELMRDTRRIAVLALLILGGYTLLIGVGYYVFFAAPGLLRVDVDDHEQGRHVSLLFPAYVINGVIDAASMTRSFSRDSRHAKPVHFDAMAGELQRYSAVPLVSVDGPDGRVRVVSRSGTLHVDVESAETSVHVTLPRSSVAVAMHALSRL